MRGVMAVLALSGILGVYLAAISSYNATTAAEHLLWILLLATLGAAAGLYLTR